MLLKDKIVIVSGIGPGLGVKLAIEAAREGARGIAISARSADKLDDAEQRIRALDSDCGILKQPTDITDRGQCDALARATVERFGRIDGLVNSAFNHGDFDHASTADLDSWRDVLETNLLGTLKMTHAVIPQMKNQGGGAIAMINTMATRQVPPVPEAGYAASKAALANTVKYLAAELGGHQIRINSVHMGWMWGAPVAAYVEEQARQSGTSIDEIKARLGENMALKRIVTDDECARAALFLTSDYASAVTGAALDANGGAYMP